MEENFYRTNNDEQSDADKEPSVEKPNIEITQTDFQKSDYDETYF